MKYSALLFSLVLFLASCGAGKHHLVIQGKFTHLQDGEFYVFSSDPSWGTFDTIRVQDGKFSFTHPLADTILLTVQYPNFMQMTVVAIPGNTITIKGDANNLLSTKVTGSKENEILTDFRHSIIGKSDAQAASMAEGFIRSHPGLYASEALLYKYFLRQEHYDYGKVNALLSLLVRHNPQRTSLSAFQAHFSSLAASSPGKPLPAFSATTLRGEKVNQATFRGKAVLITFWATWNSEMLYSASQLHRLLRPYGGRIGALNVCLDVDTAQCMQHIKSDTITGYNVCDRLSWDSPLVHTFGVRYLPGNVLVNSRGVVVARDLNQDALRQQLQKLLKP